MSDFIVISSELIVMLSIIAFASYSSNKDKSKKERLKKTVKEIKASICILLCFSFIGFCALVIVHIVKYIFNLIF